MIDRILSYNNGEPIFLSDVEWWHTFIGFEDRNGYITLY